MTEYQQQMPQMTRQFRGKSDSHVGAHRCSIWSRADTHLVCSPGNDDSNCSRNRLTAWTYLVANRRMRRGSFMMQQPGSQEVHRCCRNEANPDSGFRLHALAHIPPAKEARPLLVAGQKSVSEERRCYTSHQLPPAERGMLPAVHLRRWHSPLTLATEGRCPLPT